ncbi:hypothetical protein MMC25_000619 [Agyrium rufum]|nr:hypothetical protein [Agyrium rufum]
MPRAEVGSTKYLNNKLKSKGLQRLRWYCQVCERQMRDENGFKCHTQSESHVRQMLVVGEDSKRFINDYSNQFQRDFLQLLRTAHGEKKININHFYQEYIANKEHVHMNATRWPSLTEFAKWLGREGTCRVEGGDKGLEIAWVDNSPEALRRQDAIRKKERQDRGDEEREQRMVREQIEKARREALEKGDVGFDPDAGKLQRAEGEKVKLNLNVKAKPAKPPSPPIPAAESIPKQEDEIVIGDTTPVLNDSTTTPAEKDSSPPAILPPCAQPAKLSVSLTNSKPKNVFAAAKKNPLGNAKVPPKEQPKRPMSEAERIMRAEMEQKRKRDTMGFGGIGNKKQKVS